jgi:hypothetical protein
MSLIVKGSQGGDFERIPTGMQPGVCAKIFDLGMQPGFSGDMKRKIVILFELAERKTKGDWAGKRHVISKTYNFTLGSPEKPSNLRKDLISWRGREFTFEEASGFDIEKILGINCTLNIIEKVKADGRKFSEVSSVLPLMKGAEVLTPEVPEEYQPEWIKRILHGEDEKPVEPEGAGTSDESIPF